MVPIRSPSGAVALRVVTLSARWARPLKLDAAPLHVRFLFDRDHLPFHLSKFGCGLLIPADEERGRPEDDDGCSGRHSVTSALAMLNTGKGRRPRRNGLCFLCELRTGVGLIHDRRDVGRA